MTTDAHLTEDDMRTAVARRDPSSDGRFVYAVVTTGVFCRPSCPARPARPENLRFFPGIAEAEAAGFRACKRCRPDNPLYDVERMVELARYIEAHADDKLRLADLAERQGLSPAYLQRTFKAVFGVTPKAYQDAARLRTLKRLLKAGEGVTGAIFESGYGSPSRFYEKAARRIGMTPRAYRAGGSGESIAFASRPTAFGHLMMAATDKGVCFVMFGDSHDDLYEQLRAEFPKAALEPSPENDERLLDGWMEALEAHLIEGAPRPEVPLDLRGTAFQIKVWRFLLSIPAGDAVSYGEVAAGVDRPGAARAVGSACGGNRIAVLVPCHRVLRGDGGLGGYRWGLERKRALLDAERRGRRKGSTP